MVDIAPFRGILYDPAAVGDVAQVVAPPYDVISEADRDALEDASPYNIVRLVLGRDEPSDGDRDNKYVRARALFDAWRAAGILQEDPDEAFYLYEQRYQLAGLERTQRGLLAAVALDDPDAGGVLPHEGTYDEIVDDRLALLRATATNLDCILCVQSGQDAAAAEIADRVAATPPALRFTAEDGEHRLWRIEDAGECETLIKALAPVRVMIADGHHRHRTAQRYRDERRSAEGPGPWDRQVMLLVDATRHGPALLPIHRVVTGMDSEAARARLGSAFAIEPAARHDPEDLARQLAARRASDARTFVMLGRDDAWWLTLADADAEGAAMPTDRSPAWRDLDVSVLHALVFEHLLGGVTPGFVHHASEAAAEIDAGRADLAFLLAPAPFEAVVAVAEAGEAMPQKSTYFVPKPKTGIVLRALA